MNSRLLTALTIILSLTIFLSGCTLANRKKGGEKCIEAETMTWEEGKGDAYLFDVKIYREGKKNSVRLDVYRSGDIISLFARGYLGKGVLKGLILPDSTVVYFPTKKEYFSGKLVNLINNGCSDSLSFELLIIEFFKQTPDEIEHDLPGFYLVVLKENDREKQYRLESRSCPEGIELDYSLKSGRFILEKINYSSSDGSFRFKATRRRAKLNIDIPEEKFQLNIPVTALRISP